MLIISLAEHFESIGKKTPETEPNISLGTDDTDYNKHGLNLGQSVIPARNQCTQFLLTSCTLLNLCPLIMPSHNVFKPGQVGQTYFGHWGRIKVDISS